MWLNDCSSISFICMIIHIPVLCPPDTSHAPQRLSSFTRHSEKFSRRHQTQTPPEFKMTSWRTTAKGFVFRCQQNQARKELAYTNQSITTPLSRLHVTSQNHGQDLILNVSITIKIRPKPLQKSLNLIKSFKDNLSNLRCSHWVSEHTYALLSHG